MQSQLLPIAQKSYDLNRWLLPRVVQFDRAYKFTLGDRIQTTALDLQLSLVEAGHARSKQRALFRASRFLDQLRLLLRLARDLGALSKRQHLFVGDLIDEIGRMLGGWLRSASRRPDEDPS